VTHSGTTVNAAAAGILARDTGLAAFGAYRDYVARAHGPTFVKAHADQMAHFAAAD
jgi:glutathione S-transferase